MILELVLLAVGFIFLIKGADFLIEGASSIAKKLNVSSLVIGLTIVAFGTSMPELIVNIFASAQGNTQIAIGNILGSNIANILIILGIASMINPLVITKGTVWKEIPLSLLAALMVGILANDVLIDNSAASVLTRIDGLVLLSFFIIFMYYTFGIAKNNGPTAEEIPQNVYSGKVSVLLILAGLVALNVGGKIVVDNAISLASLLNVSETLVGVTVVAIGTSLPELATSTVAA